MSSNPGFELHGLQQLFATSVTAVNYPERFLFDPIVIREYVIAEVARIKHRLIEKALSIEGEDAVRRYVRIHQYSIVAMMDKLYKRRDQPGAMQCCEALDGLLGFVRNQFPQYFDEMGKAPLKHMHEIQIDIGISFKRLNKKLESISTFGLLNYAVLDPLERLCLKRDSERVTFNRLEYIDSILQYLKAFVADKPESDDLDRNFLDLMLYFNYNSKASYTQFIQYIGNLVPEDLDVTSKRYTLSQYLKTATQAMVKPNAGYHPFGPTLKSQVINYLTEELSYLADEEEDEEVSVHYADAAFPAKAKLNLSVAELGCLLRVLSDSGVISIANIAGLIRCLALNCETKRSRSISPESLRIKFYDVEASTVKAVRQMLGNLMKSVEGMGASA